MTNQEIFDKVLGHLRSQWVNDDDNNLIELRIIDRVLRMALERGYAVSVHDSVDWVLVRSRSHVAILNVMFATDYEMLVFWDGAGRRVGFMTFVYGNGEDVISDHTDNAVMQELFDYATGD